MTCRTPLIVLGLAWLFSCASSTAEPGVAPDAAVTATRIPAAAEDGAVAPPGFATDLGVNEFGYRVLRRHRDGARMVLVPGGHFVKRDFMFMPPERNEGSWRHVDAFLCDEHEVSNRQVQRFLEAHPDLRIEGGVVFGPEGEQPWIRDHEWGFAISDGKASVREGYEDHPAVGMSGYLALAYAKWVGGDLPTVDEFEKAAGGPSGLVFPWGGIDEKPDSTRCNCLLHGPKRTVAVKSYPRGRSPYGIWEMSGNVYERVSEYAMDLAAATPGSIPVSSMIKGGGWPTSHWWDLRCADRCGQPMEAMEGSVGFRVIVRDPARLEALGAREEKLRVIDDTEVALEEASKRNVPILLFLGYETCGNCDRVQGELFRNPDFVSFANERVVVLVGHCLREGNGVPKMPVDDQGRYFAHSGVDRRSLELIFEDFRVDSLMKYIPVPREIEYFVISPGLFLLNPHVELIESPDDTILIPEAAFARHKTGGSAEVFRALIEEAQGYLGPGATRSEFERDPSPRSTLWAPGRRRPKSPGIRPMTPQKAPFAG